MILKMSCFGEHYCEICDRGWDTPEKLSEHLKSHVTCQLDDCTFSAHPKVVAIHVKLQHATGLFKRITRTLDNEDIQKWRQERKRNYPTKENIERNKAERNEMEIRGERLQGDKKLFKKTKLSKRACRTQAIREPRTSKTKVRVSKEIDIKEGSFERNFPTFPGTGAFSLATEDVDEKSSVEENISDEEWQDELKVKPMTDNFSVCSILSALMNSYASDDSEIEDGSSDSRPLNKPQNLNIATRDVASDSDDPPVEVKNLKGPDDIPNIHVSNTHDKYIGKCKTRKRSSKMKTSSAKMPYSQQKSNPKHITIPHRRLTLLEELLKNEIRQERNQILQCIRYIVKKNFF